MFIHLLTLRNSCIILGMNEQNDLPQTEKELIYSILRIAPRFKESWEKYIGQWQSETEGIHNGIGEFARYLLDSYDKSDTSWYGEFFELIETLVVKGNTKIQELAVLGYLVTIQTMSNWRNHKGEVFIKWLGPRSKEAWDKIYRLWSINMSLSGNIGVENNSKPENSLLTG